MSPIQLLGELSSHAVAPAPSRLRTIAHECRAAAMDASCTHAVMVFFALCRRSRAPAGTLISTPCSLERSDRRLAANHGRPRQEPAEPLSGYRRSKQATTAPCSSWSARRWRDWPASSLSPVSHSWVAAPLPCHALWTTRLWQHSLAPFCLHSRCSSKPSTKFNKYAVQVRGSLFAGSGYPFCRQSPCSIQDVATALTALLFLFVSSSRVG